MDSSPEQEQLRKRLILAANRLEAATSRLEDIVSASQVPDDQQPPPGTSTAAVSRAASLNDEGIPSTTVPPGPPTSTLTPAPDLPKSIEDFDQLVREHVPPFQNLSAKIGGFASESVSEEYTSARNGLSLS